MTRRRTPTGTRAEDVKNPLFLECENRVLGYLQRIASPSNPVGDARSQKTYHDFTLGPFTLDVKCDQYAATTGNVAWEEFIFVNRGQDNLDKRDGWGTDGRLDYIAYVFPRADAQELWPCLIVSRHKMAHAIRAAIDTPDQRELKAFMKEGGDRTATGYAVNIQWLRSKGCVLFETEV